MNRFFDFWCWAIAGQDSLLLGFVALAILVFAGFAWFYCVIGLLIFGHTILGGLLIVVPIALVLMRGARGI
jgi:hypothetical protein